MPRKPSLCRPFLLVAVLVAAGCSGGAEMRENSSTKRARVGLAESASLDGDTLSYYADRIANEAYLKESEFGLKQPGEVCDELVIEPPLSFSVFGTAPGPDGDLDSVFVKHGDFLTADYQRLTVRVGVTDAGEFNLAAGSNPNVETCDQCATLDLNDGARYQAVQGTLTVMPVPATGGAHIQLTGVRFEPVSDTTFGYKALHGQEPETDCLELSWPTPEGPLFTTVGAFSAAEGWTCDPALWGDGHCHCGCGVPDADCVNTLKTTCDTCDTIGSCSDDEGCTSVFAWINWVCADLGPCQQAALGADDYCDRECIGIDPDCDNPCARDRVCNRECRGQDPDCLSHADDIQPIWDANCVSSGCHSGTISPDLRHTEDPPGSGNVVDDAWDNIVKQDSTQADIPLVTEGSVESSYLYHKLKNTHVSECDCSGSGSGMPYVAAPEDFIPLSSTDLEKIENWILQGAAE